jgi:DNA repair protein RadA/Sms
MKCRECQAVLLPGKIECPKCKARNVPDARSMEDSTVLLSDAKLAEVERVRTDLCDDVFGGGIARTSVILLGGEPGAGKTTLCLQLADVFATRFSNHEVLYIANEQEASELKTTAKRLDIRHAGRIRIVRAMGGVQHDIGDLLMRYKPCLVVLDSLTKWSGEDLNLAVVIAQRLKDYAVALSCPIIAINQVNKGGDHAGLEKLQHAVDTTAMFDILEDAKLEDGSTPRRLMTMKNRFGAAPEEQFYKMTEFGLELIELSDEEKTS